MLSPRELQARYEQGANISALLRAGDHHNGNVQRAIEISYDLQSGSYIECLRDERQSQVQDAYAAELAASIESLGRPRTVLEAGVGEGTTLSRLIERLANPEIRYFGFDLCWSRVAYAQQWLRECGLERRVSLCTASLLEIPFADNAFDVVYTSHAIEPNGGREVEILQELHRVTRGWLLLLEPAYELADEVGQERMRRHGYCRDLRRACAELGFEVVSHALFACRTNPQNPTALTVVRKLASGPPAGQFLACPRFKTPLERYGEALFSPEALSAYPILGGIPCLRTDHAIVASKWPEFARRCA
jgi:SAM-dependent methyltransferase